MLLGQPFVWERVIRIVCQRREEGKLIATN